MGEKLNTFLLHRFVEETNLIPTYRKGGSTYHTLKYVNWLEHQIEEQAETVPLSVVEKALTLCHKCDKVYCDDKPNKLIAEIKKKAGL